MLGNGERLVRSWDYATSTVKKGLSKTTTSQTLTVTNKRLISESRSERKVNRSEVPLDEVKRIDLAREVGSNVLAIVLFVLAGLLFVLGIAVGDGEIGGMIPFFIGTVLFVIIGLLSLGKGSLAVVVYSKDKYCIAMLAGASALKARAKAGKMKIKVNNVVAAEIVDQLGALIFGGGVSSVPTYTSHAAPAAPVAPAAPAAPEAPANEAML